jgi:hypothetical protein
MRPTAAIPLAGTNIPTNPCLSNGTNSIGAKMMSTSKPIEFSGTIAALAHTLGMPTSEIAAAIDDLIERGHLAPIGNGTFRFFPKPAR